jgi:cell division protein FtsN
MSTKSLEQLIGERAYEIYQKRERDGLPGSSEQDWHQAVKEVMAEVNKKDKSAAKPVEKAAVKVAAVPAHTAHTHTHAPAHAPAPKAEVKKAAPAPVPAAKPVVAPAKKTAVVKKK